ncbi:MAG: phage protein GemA/Gp16 family protein, partial [Phycisphaerae bacterium]
MTPDQIRMIHTASTRVKHNRAQYESMLRNVGGVETCKDLTNETFEDCMAFLEDCGFEGHYWRDKVAMRGSRASTRMTHKIHAQFAEYQRRTAALPAADTCALRDGYRTI